LRRKCAIVHFATKGGLWVAMHEITGNPTLGRLLPGFGDPHWPADADPKRSRCAATANNDDQTNTWREAAFRFAEERAAA
jgi:hypothetical protein